MAASITFLSCAFNVPTSPHNSGVMYLSCGIVDVTLKLQSPGDGLRACDVDGSNQLEPRFRIVPWRAAPRTRMPTQLKFPDRRNKMVRSQSRTRRNLRHFSTCTSLYCILQSSPMEYNGSAVLAMTGKNCVAIARCVGKLAEASVQQICCKRSPGSGTRVLFTAVLVSEWLGTVLDDLCGVEVALSTVLLTRRRAE